MKCPNCNTNNAKTNKYCRQCGTRLDVLVPREPEPVPAASADEVALGEELFASLELFERGEIDAALERSEKLASDNPASASAHSIVALVYERKAESALADGDSEGARDLLRRAIQHYEAIIDLNPDSAADREKLALLRLRQTGQPTRLDPKVSFGPDVGIGEREPSIAERLRRVPTPAIAGAAAFVLVVALVVAVTGLSGGRPAKTHRNRPHERPVVTVAQTESRPQEPQLRVYTFPQAQNPSASPAPLAPTPSSSPPAARLPSFSEIKPARVPKIDQELTLVPEGKPGADKPQSAPAKQPGKPADTKPAPSSQPTGDSLLANAIRLHNQGSSSEAIGAANQAIVLYRSDIESGKNVDRANRGIATASKYISLWQTSLANSSE